MVEHTEERKGDGLFEHDIFAIVVNRDLSKTQALEVTSFSRQFGPAYTSRISNNIVVAEDTRGP